MADAVIGALRVTLGADSAAFDKAMNGVARKLDTVGKKITAVAAGIGAYFSANMFKDFVGGALGAFGESQKAIGAVETALAHMGKGAGFTSGQLQEMASQLQKITTFDDDQILSKVTANLLTFGNVSGDVFVKAQKLALDLSERLGQDLQTSTIMLGKALNDPIAGLSALRRVGIQFTATQEAMIKSMVKAGRVTEAQKLMEAELLRQFGGQAEAAAKTVTGAWQQAQNAIGDAMEAIGAAIAPTAIMFSEWIKATAEAFTALDPATQKIIVAFGLLAAAIPAISLAAASMVFALGPIAPLLISIGTAAYGALAALVALAIANPIGAGLVLLGGSLLFLFTRQTQAEKAASAHKDALMAMQTAIDRVKAGVPGAVDELRKLQKQQYANAEAALAAAEAELANDRALVSDYQSGGGTISSSVEKALQDQIDLVDQLRKNMDEVKAQASEAEKVINNVATAAQGGGSDLRGWNERFRPNVRFVGQMDPAWEATHIRRPPPKPGSEITIPGGGLPTGMPDSAVAQQVSAAEQLKTKFDAIIEQMKSATAEMWTAINAKFTEGQAEAVATATEFPNSIKTALEGISTVSDEVATVSLENLKIQFWEVQDQAEVSFKKIYDAADQWLVGALGRAIDSVMGKIEELTKKFQEMYDKVVGHSYIPDMVTESTGWLKKMGVSMDQLGGGAVDRWNSNISSMASGASAMHFSEAASVNASNDNGGGLGGRGGGFRDINFTVNATDAASFRQSKGQIQADLSDMVRAAFAGR